MKRTKLLFLTYQRMVSPSAICKKTGGKRIRCRKDLKSAELETVRVSKSQTTVMTANAVVQTKEEATVYVKEFDLFVTIKLLDDTPAILSHGKLCEAHGSSYEWTSGQKPQLIKDGRRIKCSTESIVPIVVLGFFDKYFKLSYTCISYICTEGSSNSNNSSRINKK